MYNPYKLQCLEDENCKKVKRSSAIIIMIKPRLSLNRGYR